MNRQHQSLPTLVTVALAALMLASLLLARVAPATAAGGAPPELVLGRLSSAPAAKKPPAQPRALSEPFLVSDCGSCETWPPFLQAIAGDEVLIAWRGLHDDLRMELDRFGVDGSRLGRVTSLSTSGFLRILGSASDGDGWVTSWSDNNRQILYRRPAEGSPPEMAPVRINPDMPANVTIGTASLTAAPDDSLWFSWQEVVVGDSGTPDPAKSGYYFVPLEPAGR
jgi:hypothetical protein